jgi:two-component system heavy metal sensor histidine kinase CusS
LNSFRFKIALWSGLIAGVLLVGSILVLWQVSYQFNLDRLDREIRSLGQANLDRVQGPEHWVRLEDALKFVSANQSAAFIVWVKNYDQRVYQSPDWPADLAAESFPEPVRYEGPAVPRPGEVLPPPPRRGEEISPRNPALPRKAPQFYNREAGGKTWRVGVMGNPYVTLILGANMDDFDARMGELRNHFVAAVLVALLLVAGGAWLVARRALLPVTTLTRTADRVTARGLDQRIPPLAGDREFNRLITVFNEMLDRLEQSFQQATRFSADASHELKTPLARLQIELEQAQENSPSGSPQQETYSSLLDEISRLKAIVQKLLLLALADAGRLKLNCEPTLLTRMLENVIEDCRAQAPQLSVEQDLAADIRVNADPDLLEQALQNLAGNAIKYNREGGRIRFALALESGQVILRVTNTGPGILSADRERIFERFYRTDKSRSNRVDGVGLGLSLSREIIRAHNGELVLEESEAGLTCFAVKLPAALSPQ